MHKRFLIVGLLLLTPLGATAQTAPPQAVAKSVPKFDLTATQEGYLLGPGDRIAIKVFGADEFSGPQIVLPDGTITLPLVGTIVASNRTVADLSSILESRLAGFVKKPRVALKVEVLRPLRITISGEVLQPGPRQLQSLITAVGTAGGNSLPTVTSAVVQAGGVNNQADVSQIILTRRLTSGQTVERRIDLWKTIQEGKIEEDIFLKDGDAIFVPRRTADSPVDIRVLARTTLAPGRIRVRVFGEVNRASSFDLDARSTVVDAIASAGGMTNTAAPDNVEVVSLEPDGRVVNRLIDVNKAIQGDASQNLLLKDQDAVIVRRSFGGELINGINVFTGPASTIANLFFIFRNLR
jgi:polysaccharide biosynthesis/export protein